MRRTKFPGNICDVGVADKRDRALIIEPQETVPGVFHTVHPVQRLQLHAELVRKKLDLFLHVGRADGQVMQSFNLVHVFAPFASPDVAAFSAS